MLKGIAAAASGMLPQMKRQEVIANNLANAGTAGFKRDRLFVEKLDAAQRAAAPKGEAWQLGNNVGIVVDFQQGPLDRTGSPLDVALSGDGFLVLQSPNGERYTRNGHLSVDSNGLLTTADQQPVMGQAGEINLPAGTATIGSDGTISVDGQRVDKLQIVRFADPRVLVRSASSSFEIGIPTAVPEADDVTAVHQGFLERSNVNTIEEMVNMITTYRFYEADQKAVRSQDDLQGRVVNELGRAPA